MKTDKLYAFSIITGQVFPIEQDDIKLLYSYQIPLTGKPKSNCNKCYGRGYTGIAVKTKFHIMCQCTAKQILEGFDTSSISIPTMRTI